jgi:hypothetical protein
MGNEVFNIISVGMVFIGFIANAAYLKGVFGTRIENNTKDIESLRNSVTYKDTCEAIHKEVDHSIKRLEACANGALKK